MNQCPNCSRDFTSGWVCDDCIDQLIVDLWTLAWLAGELEITRTRQARIAQSRGAGRSAGGHQPLGYNQHAAVTAHNIHNWLANTVRRVHLASHSLWPANNAVNMTLWLAHEEDSLRRLPTVTRVIADVKHHTERILTAINPIPDDQTYGICGTLLGDGSTCMAHLYGPSGVTWVRCAKCLAQHETGDRLRILERRVRVLYFRAATLARLLPRLIERPVSANNIRCWAREGKPIKTGTDEDGWTTYHCGDVITVATNTAKRDRPKKEAS